ncbi:PhnB protein [Murinocardiopsis flavida]|uniref:PhnB protein n=1 Tax=Murinocardiopsis flavida TaxID=645275 RepID=A0A2P8DQ92_9ACTN|nr:VOC family protein [Murinocardiopsis flavida]PSK99362.1 PhnB protein [Murinocardiopsis flavida]
MANGTPYLTAHGAAEALEFYVSAFGAAEDSRWTGNDGRIGHAQFGIGGAVFYIADEHPEVGVLGPKSLGGTPVALMLEFDDPDAVFERAVAAGATVDRPMADQPFGERNGWLFDPFGHRWGISSRPAEIPVAELRAKVGDAYEIT